MEIKGEKYEGKPCIKCSSTERYVKSRGCVVCMRKRKAEYRQTESGKNACKKAKRRVSDLRLYGSSVDNELTAKRRKAEELKYKDEGWFDG
jgi:hypothetical protein